MKHCNIMCIHVYHILNVPHVVCFNSKSENLTKVRDVSIWN